MENRFGHTAYFFVSNKICKGKVLKNKKNKYVIKLDDTSTIWIHGRSMSDSNIFYVKKTDVIFGIKEVEKKIEIFYNQYLMDVIIDDLTEFDKYVSIFKSLKIYFPKNQLVIEINEKLYRIRENNFKNQYGIHI